MDAALGRGEGLLKPEAVLLILPAALLLAVMVVIPLLVLVWFSFLPDGPGGALAWDSYARLFETPLYLNVALKTLWTAGLAALLTALLAWPFAWSLSRLPPRARSAVLLAIVIPYLTSYLLLIYSIFVLLGPGSPLMLALHGLRLSPSGASILYTQPATVVMLVYENLPVMVFVLFSGMQRIENDLLAAAGSLGASRVGRLWHVVLPLSLPSLVYGLVLVFVPMGGAFVEPAILGGPHGLLLGNVIADQMTRADDPSFGAVLSLLLLLGTLAVTGVLGAVEPALGRRGSRAERRIAASA